MGLKAVAGLNQAAVSITGGSISGVSGVPVKLAAWGVPVGIAPTGSMGNNGAVTLGTATTRTYSNGIWLYFPASAISAGSSAGFYWTVMSTTTAGTVYNSTFDGLSVPTAGTTTAFATTGPGAYTGVTSATVALTITIPANTLGATGAIIGDYQIDHNGAAGNKTYNLFYSTTGGTDFGGANLVGSTQSNGATGHIHIQNQSSSIQSGGVTHGYGSQMIGGGTRYGTADTTASTTIVFRLTNATATNWMTVESGTFFTVQ